MTSLDNLIYAKKITKDVIKVFFVFGLLCMAIRADENTNLEVNNAKNKKVYAIFNSHDSKKSTMGFEIGGIIKKKYVNITSVVKKGDILFELVNDVAKSKVDIAKAKYELAKKDYERYKKIKNVIDKAQFNKYKYAYLQSKANLELNQAMLEKTIIRAPYDGMITSTFYEDGDIVPAFSKVLKIQDSSEIILFLEFDEKYYNSVKVGDKFVYKVDEYKAQSNSSSPTKEYVNVGYISKVHPTIDTKTRKIKAQVRTTNIPDGLFGDGYIIINSKEQ